MCPAGSPAGAEPPRRAGHASGAEAAAFSSAAASEILGLSTAELARWETASAALRLAPALGFAELLALAVVGEASRRLGDRAGDFTLGLCRLFVAMADAGGLEQLDDHVALVGRDFARIARLKKDHIRCAGDDFLVVPLKPILAGLRDQVFP